MPAKKEYKHAEKSCGGIFDTEVDSQGCPSMVCSKCGFKIDDWAKWKTTYSNYWQDQEKWLNKKDHLTCLISYFAKLYRDHYDIDFTFSLNDKGLFRSTEAHMIRKMFAMLEDDVMMAKSYLEWIFETKVRIRKKRITGLSFLAFPQTIQEFKLKQEKSKKINRNTPIPAKMVEWAQKFAPGVLETASLKDFGELHLLITYFKEGHYSNIEDVRLFVDKLISTKYLDPNLNINNWSN